MSSSISRLPVSATQSLGTDVVIVSPSLVVKELLDNAIDAKATSVEVLISPDTISKREVRDNGLGIHPDDFDALGRHGYTSKLRNIEELGNIVGKSLGFRGEALASINSVASVTITTKTSTEPIATTVQLRPDGGGILMQKPSSAPVGTTVSVTNLFSRRPVRQQMAVREADKSHNQIQELLRSYIMARPQLKVVFKILHSPLKAWAYSPNRNATVKEAVLQLLGVGVASKCILKTFESSHATTANSSTEESYKPLGNNFILEAYLANPDVDLQKLPKHHYCSIDGRPMNVGRGVAKRLLKIYLEHLKLSTLPEVTSDSFIQLNIYFSPGSYDVNIEPSKDDVLLSDEQAVTDAFRCLCSETYKPAAVGCQNVSDTRDYRRSDVTATNAVDRSQPLHTHSSQTRASLSDEAVSDPHRPSQRSNSVSKRGNACSLDEPIPVEKLMGDQESQKTQPSSSISFTPINAGESSVSLFPGVSSNGQSNSLPASNQWKVDMSVDLSERPKRTYQQPPREARKSLVLQEVATERASRIDDGLNPWVIAKQKNPNEVSSDAVSSTTIGRLLTPEPPILRHVMAPPGDLEVPRHHQDADRNKLHCLHRSNIPGGPYRSPMASPLRGKPQGISLVPPNHSHTTRRRHEQLPWTPPSSLDKHRYLDVSQVASTHPTRADQFKQTQIAFSGARSNRQPRRMQSDAFEAKERSEGLSSEFEANKNPRTQDFFSTAKRNLHYQLSQIERGQEYQATQADRASRSQMHHPQPSRQRQPFTVLQTNAFENNNAQGDRQPIATTLPIGDPRAYLLRRQKSLAAAKDVAKLKKMSRVKSSLMPLQSTPPEYQTFALCYSVSIDSLALNKWVRRVKEYDEYVVNGATFEGLDMSLSEGHTVESQLQKLLTSQKENIENFNTNDDHVTIGLQTSLKGKGVTSPQRQ